MVTVYLPDRGKILGFCLDHNLTFLCLFLFNNNIIILFLFQSCCEECKIGILLGESNGCGKPKDGVFDNCCAVI